MHDLSTRQSGVQMLQKGNTLSFLSTRSIAPRPLSEATEIFDTDFEADFTDEEYDSPRISSYSLGGDSETTVSTPDELLTPNSNGLGAFNFHFDEKPVEGPTGPHLFRASTESTEFQNSQDLDFYIHLLPPVTPHDPPTRIPTAIRDPPPEPPKSPNVRPFSSLNRAVAELDEAQVRGWSPRQVSDWMYDAGFEHFVVEKFLNNDITGAVLLDLQFEDLKELDIQSFGKRHRLMNSIQHLRNSTMLMTPIEGPSRASTLTPGRKNSIRTSPQPQFQPPSPLQPQLEPEANDCHMPTSPEDEQNASPHPRRRRQRRNRHRSNDDISPAESVSIVAIEQLLPKPHKCSKGEDCPKWQKQQRKLARLAKEFPIEPERGGSTLIAGDPGNPKTAENILTRPKSDAEPSVVASSDVLGPTQLPAFRLSPEKLSEVIPRDPQENVRQFLSFQHMNAPSPVEDPATPPMEMFPSLSPPRPPKQAIPLSEHLRNLPKLSIPFTPSLGETSHFSPLTAITPSMGLRKMSKTPATTLAAEYNNPYFYGQAMSPADSYRQTTPFSEMDVPITAIPLGPVARETSQSVPPDMRFGGDGATFSSTSEPIRRPTSSRPARESFQHHHRRPSFATATAMARVEEGIALRPVHTLEDITPRPLLMQQSRSQCSDITHAGWMKKRKTTRLLRHEWQDHHFTLRGTRLAMHKDEQSAFRTNPDNGKALEYIDVDEYAVACSSLASSSKLSAAFKRSILKKRDNVADEAAFAFSLVPTSEKRQLFMAGGKSHHFAVRNRDERIDWMRELMLAKALKKGREEGGRVIVNGNVI